MSLNGQRGQRGYYYREYKSEEFANDALSEARYADGLAVETNGLPGNGLFSSDGGYEAGHSTTPQLAATTAVAGSPMGRIGSVLEQD